MINIEYLEFISRLSELIKCTLAGFGWVYKMESEFIATKIFSSRFVEFIPKGYVRIDELPYKKYFWEKTIKK